MFQSIFKDVALSCAYNVNFAQFLNVCTGEFYVAPLPNCVVPRHVQAILGSSVRVDWGEIKLVAQHSGAHL